MSARSPFHGPEQLGVNPVRHNMNLRSIEPVRRNEYVSKRTGNRYDRFCSAEKIATGLDLEPRWLVPSSGEYRSLSFRNAIHLNKIGNTQKSRNGVSDLRRKSSLVYHIRFHRKRDTVRLTYDGPHSFSLEIVKARRQRLGFGRRTEYDANLMADFRQVRRQLLQVNRIAR